MLSNELPPDYDIAEGPDGLMSVLEGLLAKANQDPAFIAQDHFILYQLGNQKSIIKVDMTQTPYHFIYNDLLGRPATNVVKDTIVRFLWERCGEEERYLKELKEKGGV